MGSDGSVKRSSRGDYSEQWAHCDVGHLIVARQHYTVYLDSVGDLDWETSTEYDGSIVQDPLYDRVAHSAILVEAAVLEASPSPIGSENRRNFRRLIGEALACSFNLDYPAARQMLREAKRYLRSRSEETSRSWYLLASGKAAFVAALLGVALWLLREHSRQWLGESAFLLSLCASLGSVGALFSVITRTGKLKFDCSAGRELHVLEGTSRIVAGAISGVLVGLAIRSEMLFAALARGEHAYAVMFLGALAAGGGERLAASIISKFDAGELDESRKQSAAVQEGTT